MNKGDVVNGAMYRLLATPEHKLETWCKHNLLIAHVFDDGSIWFKDTYWGSSSEYKHTFEDVGDRIELVFDMNHAKQVSRREWMEYDESDRTWTPMGGREERYIVDDRADKSNYMIICMLESDIDALTSRIRVAQHNIDIKRDRLDKLLGMDRT